MKKIYFLHLKVLIILLTLAIPFLGYAQNNLDYFEGFEGTSTWHLANGSANTSGSANKWVVGSATNNGGTKSLYISNDDGATNGYGNTSSINHAYMDFNVPAGVSNVDLSFDFRSVGESFWFFGTRYNDYMQVRIVPTSTVITAGTMLTNGSQIGANSDFDNIPNFKKFSQSIDVSAYAGGSFRLVFTWRNNDNNTVNNPPAAIDNLSLKLPCGLPSNFSSSNITNNSLSVSWNAAVPVPPGGYEYYYNTSSTTPTSGTTPSGTTPSTSANLTGLSANTTYYVWVRSVCSSTKSSWVLGGNFTTLPGPCAGIPTGGTASLSPNSGTNSSIFTASVSGGSVATGLEYQWQVATTPLGPWTDVQYATAANAMIKASATTGVLFYRRKTVCTHSAAESYSDVVSFTSNGSSGYCTPTFQSPSGLYIKSFQFIGVLNSPPANISTYNTTGYQNHTTFTPVAEQAQGSVLNVLALSESNYPASGDKTYGGWKAWVDWNNDGDFTDNGEMVYSMVDYSTPSVTFGFVIPQGQAVGDYRLRIGTWSTTENDSGFTSCGNLPGRGEREDYIFKVVYDPPAKIDVKATNSTFRRCGNGSITLTAVGNSSTTNFKWYSEAYEGSALHTGASYSTTISKEITRFYVSAVDNKGYETPYRYPIDAIVEPQPKVYFNKSTNDICGEEVPSVNVTAAGDKYQEVYFEPFDSGLGIFKQTKVGTYTNALADWKNVKSPYYPTNPPYEGLSPALSSGYFGSNFVVINTDIANPRGTIENYIENSDNTLNVKDFLEIKIEFNLYYFSIAEQDSDGFLHIEYSVDGTNWTQLEHRNKTVESKLNPLNWEKFEYYISRKDANNNYIPFNSTNFKLRFTVKSRGYSTGFFEGITALDNIRISGLKLINTPFSWSSTNTTLYQSNCTTPLGSALTSTICIKPTPTELEELNWKFNANATFSNGCPAYGEEMIENNSKTWKRPSPSTVDWKLANEWLPVGVPDITKCVIVRTPTVLEGADLFARNILVKPAGGKVTIKSGASLTTQNYVKNQATAADFVVESDANLKQTDDVTTNEGSITVKRNAPLRRLEYIFWGSPVKDQILKTFSPGTLANRFYTYDDRDDSYVVVDYNTAFIPAKGYAIRAPNNYTTTSQTFYGNFVGVPNNGLQNIDIYLFAHPTTGVLGGRNLVSNPYPSNINLKTLAQLNPGVTNGLYYFWTNDLDTYKMTNNATYGIYGVYTTNRFAVLNALGSTPATAAADKSAVVPSYLVKPGQGFIVQATNTGKLNFNNSVRTTAVSDELSRPISFYSKTSSKEDIKKSGDIAGRYWLSLISPAGTKSTMLVGYVSDASNDLDNRYDASLAMSSSDGFYSVLNDEKLAIQGRDSKDMLNDKVQLGIAHYAPGEYLIKVENKDGVFADGQKLYIKDNMNGSVTELTSDGFKYNSEAPGTVEGRFEIIYTNRVLSSNDVKQIDDLIVYKTNEAFFVKSNEKIRNIDIFDMGGRLVQKIEANGSLLQKVELNGNEAGTYILKIAREKSLVTKKIIK